MSITVTSKATVLLMNGDWKTTMDGNSTHSFTWRLYAGTTQRQENGAGPSGNFTVVCTFAPGNPPLPTFSLKMVIDQKDWISETVPPPPDDT